MVFDDQKVCRLCFASESNSRDTAFTSIQKFLPLLDSLAGVSHAEDRPQNICSNCEFTIETTLLLRKRVQFTETVWIKYRTNSDCPESFSEREPLMCDRDLLLNCHLCEQMFDYNDLQSHIALEHGKEHMSECGLCYVLLGYSSVFLVASQMNNPPPARIPKSEADDATSCSLMRSGEYSPDLEEDLIGNISSELEQEAEIAEEKTKTEKPEFSLASLGYNVSTSVNSLGINETIYSCKVCKMKSSRKSNVERHFKKKHDQALLSGVDFPTENFPAETMEYLQEESDNHEEDTTPGNAPKRSKLQCPKCDQSFTLLYGLQRHMKNKHKDFVPQVVVVTVKEVANESGKRETFYECKICKTSYKSKTRMESHIRKSHNPNATVRMVESDDEYAVDSIQENASASCTTEAPDLDKDEPEPMKEKPSRENLPGSLQCQACGIRTTRFYSLKRHMAKHQNLHCCGKCLTIFDTRELLLEHIKEAADQFGTMGVEEYACERCQESFSANCKLQRHIIRHSEYYCGKCDLVFSDHSEFRAHDQQHDKKYSCKKCELTFESKLKRDQHIKSTHTGTLCGICGKCVIGGKYNEHLRKHKGIKNFKCGICEKSFFSRDLLKKHVAIHSDARPFVCDVDDCSVGFRTSRALLAHRKTHGEEKRYKCHYVNCDRAFHQNFDLNLHLRRHTGEKPFECTGCGESFYTRSLLRKHLETCRIITVEEVELKSEC